MTKPFFLGGGIGLLLLVPSTTTAAPIGRVAVVVDGPSDLLRSSVQVLRAEVENLVRDRGTDLRFPEAPTHMGDFTEARTKALVAEVMADPKIEAVVGLGFFVGLAVAQTDRLTKPVFLPFAAPVVQGLPREGARSGKKNLAYLTGLLNLEVELRRFQDVITRSRSVYLVDEAVFRARPKAIQTQLQESSAGVMEIELLPVGDSAEAILSAIPESAQAVYIGTLLRMPFSEVPALIEGLNARRLPSYASEGRQWVEDGAFVTLVREDEVQRRMRRIALYLDEVASGEEPATLSNVFEAQTQLVINMATARRIGVSPRFGLLTEALLLGNNPEARGQSLSLKRAVVEAIASNRDLVAVQKETDIAEADFDTAWGEYLPRVTASGDATWIDPDTASAFFDSERSLNVSLEAEQLLFEPNTFNAIKTGDANRRAAAQVVRSAVLDTIQSSAAAYLTVLRTRTSERINQDNLRRVRKNLSLAELRVEIGSSSRDEVFRWQSELADGRVNVISASASRNQAEIGLNQTLNRDLETPFRTVEPFDPDEGILISKSVETYIDNPFSFRVFRDFMAEEAKRNSPELKELAERVDATGYALQGIEQQIFILEIFVTGNLFHTAARDGAGSESIAGSMGIPTRVDTFWQTALNLRWTVFDYTRYPRIRSIRQSLTRQQLEVSALSQAIESEVRRALHQAGAARASIELRKDAAAAAEANMELVADRYRQGKVDIVRLLDAQNEALEANLASANAVYDFLDDYVAVERAAGEFQFMATDSERSEFEDRLRDFAKQYEEQGR